MSSLVVGGVAIKVAVSSPRWTRSDGVDRSRSLDGTLRASQTGGAVRVWDFETPPVLASTEGETYKAALSTIASQLCSGDIIAIPTMCSAELADGVPTAVAGDPFVVLSFSLHEVQPTKTLLRYASADTISGESFSRATVATYIDVAGVIQNAAINVKRSNHWQNGLRTTLLEGARINNLLHSLDLTNAVWGKSNATISTIIADPAGGSAACRITATAANGSVLQFLADGASAVRTNSVWLRRAAGTGPIDFYNPLDAGSSAPVLTPVWQRFTNTGSASVSRKFEIIVRTSGDAIDFYNGQQEEGAFATSDIYTTTAAVTRAADIYSMPFTTPPQEMTVYAKFVERGNVLTGAGTVFQISNAASGNARFESWGATYYNAYHHNDGTGSVSTVLSVAPVLGDTVELAFRLYGDGSVDVTQSINGGVATTATRSAAHDFAAVWSGPLLWLNSAGSGTEVGFAAFNSLKIVAGARSLAEMRTI